MTKYLGLILTSLATFAVCHTSSASEVHRWSSWQYGFKRNCSQLYGSDWVTIDVIYKSKLYTTGHRESYPKRRCLNVKKAAWATEVDKDYCPTSHGFVYIAETKTCLHPDRVTSYSQSHDDCISGFAYDRSEQKCVKGSYLDHCKQEIEAFGRQGEPPAEVLIRVHSRLSPMCQQAIKNSGMNLAPEEVEPAEEASVQ